MRVICQLGDSVAADVRKAVPDVDVVVAPSSGELGDDVHGEVLFTSNLPVPLLADVLDRGVEWVQLFGTGIDKFPIELCSGKTLTTARGVSAIPIAEFVIASVLAAEKRFPDCWL